ncbi:hypothetical protein V499_04176 [Pseudogymnoascus sp. VKM F-103]|nr:hypothetical protein V499_04176 [Pseudogymnoascus sp. VKM F-103]
MPTFSSLPPEIRALIWKATVEPRTVEVRMLPLEKGKGKAKVRHLVSPTPVPAPLQTCREARGLGLYAQAFAEVEEVACADGGAEPRYVWLNPDIDIVSLGPTRIGWFKAVAGSIRRLQIERENTRVTFEELVEVCQFENAEEICIICADGMEVWHRVAEDHFWPCELEKVIFIDALDGRVMNSVEMDRVFDEVAEERDRIWRLGEQERLQLEAGRQLEGERQLEDE